MGYGYVPNIKDEAVVCQSPCKHTDCAYSRKEWDNAKCAICNQPLLAEQPFYYEPNGASHAHCVQEQANL